MDALLLARWQFATTTVYHFFFVPVTLGLAWIVAILETMWVTSGREVYRALTKFWGRLFLVNFAMGVVTGIVQEFQFGMNWSEYSRFVGDIFGAPLAIEALLAFFLESTFLGVWIFGWDRLPKRVHLASIWLVAVGSTLSAFWILVANSFMQEPVGYVLRNGRAEMVDFAALVTNPNLAVQVPHVMAGALATAAFLVLGISAWHLRRASDAGSRDAFERSFRLGAVCALVATLAVLAVGHVQGQHVVRAQPMKMAAAEALWRTENPAALSLVTWVDERGRRNLLDVEVPRALSLLAHNRLTGEVQGITELQADYVRRYGPGDYVPPVFWAYWMFRLMVGAGGLMLLLSALATLAVVRRRWDRAARLAGWLVPAIILPFVANTAGWLLTEMGRQPWIVFGLQKTADAVSPTVGAGAVLLSLAGFVLLYGILMGVDVRLSTRLAIAGIAGPDNDGHGAGAEAAAGE